MGDETDEAETLALQALGWAMSDESRAGRFLALTGLTPETLREGIGDLAVLAATLRFLEAHEPDLMACASDLKVSPSNLVRARATLER